MPQTAFAFDPRKEICDVRESTHCENPMVFARVAVKTMLEIIAARQAADEPEPFLVPAAFRKKLKIKKEDGTFEEIVEVRTLNFNPGYPGRVGHAEELIRGEWRLASPDEVKAEHARQHAARTKYARSRFSVDALAAQAKAING